MALKRLRAGLALVFGFLVFAAAHGAPITAVGPAENKTAPTATRSVESLKLAPAAPATRIALSAPSDAERVLVKVQNAMFPATSKQAAKGAKARPLAIGYGRDVPAASQRVSLSALSWQTLADGSRAAKVQIVSPDAAALRVAVKLGATDPDLTVRFSGNAPNAAVFGPIPANTIADDTARFGVFWSPTLDGDVATIEFHA